MICGWLYTLVCGLSNFWVALCRTTYIYSRAPYITAQDFVELQIHCPRGYVTMRCAVIQRGIHTHTEKNKNSLAIDQDDAPTRTSSSRPTSMQSSFGLPSLFEAPRFGEMGLFRLEMLWWCCFGCMLIFYFFFGRYEEAETAACQTAKHYQIMWVSGARMSGCLLVLIKTMRVGSRT